MTDPDKPLSSRRIILKSSLPDKLEVKNITSTLKDLVREASPRRKMGETTELVAELASVPASYHQWHDQVRDEYSEPALRSGPRLDQRDDDGQKVIRTCFGLFSGLWSSYSSVRHWD